MWTLYLDIQGILIVWFLHFFFLGVGDFQKSYVMFGGALSKYLLFLTGGGRWSGKGPKHPYLIKKWPFKSWFLSKSK